MTRADAVKYIEERNGLIFSVKFRKRTTGEVREMVCRQGVTKELSAFPSKPGTDWKANGLIPVYEMTIGQYRCIPIEGIIAIRVSGEWEDVC